MISDGITMRSMDKTYEYQSQVQGRVVVFMCLLNDHVKIEEQVINVDISANTDDTPANTNDIPANTNDIPANTNDTPVKTNDTPAKKRKRTKHTSEDGSTVETPAKKKSKAKAAPKKTMDSAANITLDMLDDLSRSLLLDQARRQILDKSAPKDVDLFNVDYLGHIYTVGHLVKYLHPVARFAIKNGGPPGGHPSEQPPTLHVRHLRTLS
ncbi:hypothetical protein MMC12_007904 [Toensbergia leucococca]|nr:hypothetical protein [Toensbergia leucococca]